MTMTGRGDNKANQSIKKRFPFKKRSSVVHAVKGILGVRSLIRGMGGNDYSRKWPVLLPGKPLRFSGQGPMRCPGGAVAGLSHGESSTFDWKGRQQGNSEHQKMVPVHKTASVVHAG